MIEQLKYIAVEGPIGVGKSSLARILAEDLGAKAVIENPDLNPFLENFYEDPEQFAFQTQLYFLLSRYNEQKSLNQQNLFESQVVCDYLFAKDLLFAQMNLSEDEYRLYLQVYKLLDQKLPKPDVTIFLQAEPDVLRKRIKKRNKSYEKSIDPDYVLEVAQNYSQFFFQYSETPLLVVNTTGIDFVNCEEDYLMLKQEIVNLMESGKDKRYVTIDH